MKYRIVIGDKAVETEIGDGVIHLSWMNPQQLAEHLHETISRALKEPALELLAKEITRIREEPPARDAT